VYAFQKKYGRFCAYASHDLMTRLLSFSSIYKPHTPSRQTYSNLY